MYVENMGHKVRIDISGNEVDDILRVLNQNNEKQNSSVVKQLIEELRNYKEEYDKSFIESVKKYSK